MAEFKKGDTVQLKSGGPLMTIEEFNEAGATCVWFDGKDPRYQSFDPVVLKPVEAGGGGRSVSRG